MKKRCVYRYRRDYKDKKILGNMPINMKLLTQEEIVGWNSHVTKRGSSFSPLVERSRNNEWGMIKSVNFINFCQQGGKWPESFPKTATFQFLESQGFEKRGLDCRRGKGWEVPSGMTSSYGLSWIVPSGEGAGTILGPTRPNQSRSILLSVSSRE